MEKEKILTYEELMAGFDRIEKMQEENAKGFAELREEQKESAKKSKEEWAELREQQKESAKRFEEELREQQKRSEKEWSELRETMKETNKQLGGIGRSNGKMAEDYFYNSLNKTKTLGGVHFDSVERNLKGFLPLDDGKTLNGEYDITLINKDSLGIVEVKYTVEKDDIENLVENQVKNFKMLFPMYANYKFYLGIGGLSFNKQAEDAAKKLGVGMLKLNGDAVEINDENLKVY